MRPLVSRFRARMTVLRHRATRFAQDDLRLLKSFEGDEEEVDGERHPQGDDQVGDVEAGVEVGSYGGGQGQRGIESSSVGVPLGRDGGVEAQAERVDGEQQCEHAQRQRNARGPVVLAEEAHGAGGHPVHQRRLVEEAQAVDVGRHEIVTMQHLPSDLDVNGVDIVQQPGREQAASLQHQPCKDDDRDRTRIPAARH